MFGAPSKAQIQWLLDTIAWLVAGLQKVATRAGVQLDPPPQQPQS